MGSIECEIPVIDISPWLDGSGRDDVVDKIRGACITYGFFQLVGHGVPIALQHEAFNCAKRFFSLPLEEKMALAKDPWTGRGYEMSGSQALQAGETPDTKEVSLQKHRSIFLHFGLSWLCVSSGANSKC